MLTILGLIFNMRERERARATWLSYNSNFDFEKS